MLMESAQDTADFDGAGGGGGASASLAAVEPKLNSFAQALDRVLRSYRSGTTGDYKVYINDEAIKVAAPTNGNTNTYISAAGGTAAPKKKRVINYWCFSTGVAMSELQRLGVKSLLLTSGTLSPMAALREDIKLPFPVQLENPHVIR